MLSRMKMRGGVMIGRRIATADVPARHAETQVHPRVADSQTIFTAARTRRHGFNLIKMRTCFRHDSSTSAKRRQDACAPNQRAPSQMVDSTFLTPYNATENAAPPPPRDIRSAFGVCHPTAGSRFSDLQIRTGATQCLQGIYPPECS